LMRIEDKMYAGWIQRSLHFAAKFLCRVDVAEIGPSPVAP
jgi:hypothetical protein